MPNSLNNYSLLVFLGAVWGASFVAIKYCSILFNPIEVGFFRTFIAAIFLLLIVSLRKGNYNFFGKNTFTYRYFLKLKNIGLHTMCIREVDFQHIKIIKFCLP